MPDPREQAAPNPCNMMATIDAREMAEAMARWMGWTECKRPGFGEGLCPPGSTYPDNLPKYASSLDAMREVEDEIERRGLVVEYMALLRKVWRESTGAIDEWMYFLLRASALQRLQAAARVIQEVERAG